VAAGTAVLRFGGRSLCREAALRAATGAMAESIYLEANPNDNTLLRYRYNREFKADRGRHGEGSNCTGHSGGHDLAGNRSARWHSMSNRRDYRGFGDARPARIDRAWRTRRGAAISILQSRGTRRRESMRRSRGGGTPLAAGAEVARRCGTGGIPECGQVDADLRNFGGAPKIANYPFTTLEQPWRRHADGGTGKEGREWGGRLS